MSTSQSGSQDLALDSSDTPHPPHPPEPPPPHLPPYTVSAWGDPQPSQTGLDPFQTAQRLRTRAGFRPGEDDRTPRPGIHGAAPQTAGGGALCGHKTEFRSAPPLPIFSPGRGGPGRPGSTVTARGRAWSRSETLEQSRMVPPGEHIILGQNPRCRCKGLLLPE